MRSAFTNPSWCIEEEDEVYGLDVFVFGPVVVRRPINVVPKQVNECPRVAVVCREGHVRNVESIFTARVPIVKFCDLGTSIECDLSVENKVGNLKSQIIRIISQTDGKFQKLCMLVKHWAKAHEVNSTLHRTLNSFSITLLAALHLQTQNPSILPPFSTLFRDGIDPPNVEKRTQMFLNWGQRGQKSINS
ncbi:unnamed protein product [Arabidopsis lyrata]|uniref:Predicted protein n=1 Tax=Arabidopsis lyrata subsp. lyrata TaxID=81972 RepID=D7LMR4_ARALL|nr:predicted protein [Arabidopsis lyrata subsp. lyrata]CAH8267553.1 unnamed protein product [Arabidopsis lyrata]